MFNPETIAGFPAEPGVYIMKNAAGDIIYVGKAANLRNRVRNYFSKTGDNRFSVQFLVRHVETIETIVTTTEKEAFLLENTLIKQHRPRYNIRLRDDKTYVSLRFKMNHDYPRLEVTRVRRAQLGSAGETAVGTGKSLLPNANEKSEKRAKVERLLRESDRYFGPYTSSGAVKETMRFLLKIFPVRTCRDSFFNNRTRPCILFDVGKCCGPCTEDVPKDYYRNLVDQVSTFLRGKNDEVRATLVERMLEFSENMEFEKAALIRDRIQALDRTLEFQSTETHEGGSRDVIAIHSTQGRSLVVVQQFRNGVLIHSTEFYTKNYEQDDGEVLYSFISQHYENMSMQIPPEILVNETPQDFALLEEWLKEERGMGVRLHVPQRGKLAALIHSAKQNARAGLNRRLSGERTEDETLSELSKKLGLEKEPRTIECVDISNIMGTLAVGSITRFEDAKPDKAGYRLYRIRTVEGSNDFAMMKEVLTRRFRSDNSGKEFPDLLIVDGGKGQLGIAEEVFRELGIHNVALAGMAKSRLKVREVELPPLHRDARVDTPAAKPSNTFFPDAPNYVAESEAEYGTPALQNPIPDKEIVRFRTEERMFLPGRKNPVTFARNSPALFLLERIRDETHRTAITYHRKLRQKTNRRSILDEIPGIGPRRKKQLLKHFGSLMNLKNATAEEIAQVEGVNRTVAEGIVEFLKQQDSLFINSDAFREGRVTVEEDDFNEADGGGLAGSEGVDFDEDFNDEGTEPEIPEKPDDFLDATDRRRF